MSKVLVVLVPLVITIAAVFFSVHKVHEGYVGLYWVGGALEDDVSSPGFHFMVPFVTRMAEVQVTLQTDTVVNIPCGTSGGSIIYFDKVEVVNELDPSHAHHTVKAYGVNYDKIWIFDKIHHEINQFCSSHSLQEVYIDKFDTLDEALVASLQKDCDKYKTGIKIIAVRVTKPRIPETVRQNFENVEEEKTRLAIASAHQKVVQKEQETERLKATIEAEKEAAVSLIDARRQADVEAIKAELLANVSKIRLEMEILEKEGEKIRSLIENKLSLEKQKAIAEARRYKLQREAEANKLKFTPQYMKYVLYKSLANNSKTFYGPTLADMYLEWLGGESNIPSEFGIVNASPQPPTPPQIDRITKN